MKRINRLLTFVIVMLFFLNSIVSFSLGSLHKVSRKEKDYREDIQNLMELSLNLHDVADEEFQSWIDDVINNLNTPNSFVIITEDY